MKAWELLATPDKWTQGVGARDARGREVSPSSKKAKCWCIYGAINKCYGNDGFSLMALRIERLIPTYVSTWNDNPKRTHAEVIEVLKKADV
jgi:hypothetical protein